MEGTEAGDLGASGSPPPPVTPLQRSILTLRWVEVGGLLIVLLAGLLGPGKKPPAQQYIPQVTIISSGSEQILANNTLYRCVRRLTGQGSLAPCLGGMKHRRPLTNPWLDF